MNEGEYTATRITIVQLVDVGVGLLGSMVKPGAVTPEAMFSGWVCGWG